MSWRFWRKSNGVLIVGYSPRLLNGVTTNTELLIRNIPYLELHVAVRCYNPRWKSLVTSIYGVVVFALRLLVGAPQVAQILIGSRGDTVKTLPYLCLAKLRGCSVSLHFHMTRANLVDNLPQPVRCVVLWFWRRVDCFCFLSPRLRDEFADQLDPQIQRAVIPNPVSKQWLENGVLPRSDRSRDLVFLGRWSHEKGMDDLLAVMRTLDADVPVHCDIYSDQLRKETPANCSCHTWVKEDEVRRILQESKLLLLPSHFEGYPIVLVQAAACGTPFVSTPLPGVLDIAEESQAGVLHDIGDIEGMQRAIGRLLRDENLWADCSSNGRRWAESLEVSNVVQAWDRLYADLGIKLP